MDPIEIGLWVTGGLLVMVLMSLFSFSSAYLENFSTQLRDVGTAGFLLVLTAFMARVVVATSEAAASMVGFDAEPTSVWYLVPVAGCAMVVRTLLGVGWT